MGVVILVIKKLAEDVMCYVTKYNLSCKVFNIYPGKNINKPGWLGGWQDGGDKKSELGRKEETLG